MRTLLLLAAALALAGCDTTLDAKDYSQTCSVDADCVPVFVGEVCNACGGCQSAAINKADKGRYDADAKAISGSCIRLPGPPVACAAAACLAPVGACVNGACTIRPVMP